MKSVAPVRSEEPMTPGTKLGRYEIRSKLGKGGMGEVYLAKDTQLDRQVGLKVLLDEVADDDERVSRFTQEAKAASALNHPNILTVHEIGEFEGTRYIATELIKGETLRNRLRIGPMSLSEVLNVAIQVATALSAAHDAGIVHRDIKPENIMLRDDGIVKVLDFGLAKLVAPPKNSVDSEGETRALVDTQPGMVMGTVLYMSPEQARSKHADAARVFDNFKESQGIFSGSGLRGYVYGKWGKRPEAFRIIDELNEQSKHSYVLPETYAYVYAGLGDKEQAFLWLQKSCDQGSLYLQSLKVDPMFDELRSDPRFAKVVRLRRCSAVTLG